MNSKEFEKLKINDKVICNTNCSRYASFLPKKGEKGKITYVSQNCCRIQWENSKTKSSWNWFAESNNEYENVSSIDLYKEQLEFEF